jgi:hypothetical protein
MGSGSRRLAPVTGPAKDNVRAERSILGLDPRTSNSSSHWQANGLSWDPFSDTDHESDQANRAISTGKLNALLRLHPRPINVVVFHGSQGSSRFEVGFPLRCLQRLSRPYIATLHCGWRHNSSTRGTFIPVLSY